MPGFNVNPLGGGYTPNGPSNLAEPRRKHRWVFETLGRGTGYFTETELLLLQSASRPSPKFEAVEMHHNQEVAKFAGKQTWEPINMVWYDVEQNPDVSKGIYQWVETVVNMRSIGVAHPRNYKKTASLALLDGTGQRTQLWTMFGTWPREANLQELNYTSNEILTCEVQMEYDRAVLGDSNGQCLVSPEPRVINPTCPI